MSTMMDLAENILQISLSTPFASTAHATLSSGLESQYTFYNIQSNSDCVTPLLYLHVYTFSLIFSPSLNYCETQDRPTWRWSRCVPDVMSSVRRVSWETGMAWPVKPQWAGGVILQLIDRLRDSHMAHISKWQPVTDRRSTIRPCHPSPDWTRPTVLSHRGATCVTVKLIVVKGEKFPFLP